MPRIRNFQQVTPWLYRGGQPNDEGFKQLAELGIKTIISLRSGSICARMERHRAEEMGMTLVHFPFTYFNLPDDDTIAEFLTSLDDRALAPVFVHCLHGVDRTGFMIALFRMASMGWTVTESYHEMKRCGFHTFRLPHFKWVLWDYARKIGTVGNKHDRFTVKRAQR